MKRLRRRFLNGAAAACAALCIESILLWVRSYWVGDYIRISHFVRPSVPADNVFAPTNFYEYIEVRCGTGRIDIEWEPNAASASDQREPFWYHASTEPFQLLLKDSSVWERIGLLSRPETIGQDRAFLTSFWALALVTALPLVPWLRLRRQKGGSYCEECGYGLRETPSRCPECGTVPIRSIPSGEKEEADNS